MASARHAAAFVEPQPRLPGKKAQQERAAREFATRGTLWVVGKGSVEQRNTWGPPKKAPLFLLNKFVLNGYTPRRFDKNELLRGAWPTDSKSDALSEC